MTLDIFAILVNALNAVVFSSFFFSDFKKNQKVLAIFDYIVAVISLFLVSSNIVDLITALRVLP